MAEIDRQQPQYKFEEIFEEMNPSKVQNLPQLIDLFDNQKFNYGELHSKEAFLRAICQTHPFAQINQKELESELASAKINSKAVKAEIEGLKTKISDSAKIVVQKWEMLQKAQAECEDAGDVHHIRAAHEEQITQRVTQNKQSLAFGHCDESLLKLETQEQCDAVSTSQQSSQKALDEERERYCKELADLEAQCCALQSSNAQMRAEASSWRSASAQPTESLEKQSAWADRMIQSMQSIGGVRVTVAGRRVTMSVQSCAPHVHAHAGCSDSHDVRLELSFSGAVVSVQFIACSSPACPCCAADFGLAMGKRAIESQDLFELVSDLRATLS